MRKVVAAIAIAICTSALLALQQKQTVTAHAFYLENSRGELVGAFTTTEQGDPALTLKRGDSRVQIHITGESPSILMHHAERKGIHLLVIPEQDITMLGLMEDLRDVTGKKGQIVFLLNEDGATLNGHPID